MCLGNLQGVLKILERSPWSIMCEHRRSSHMVAKG